ncbi:2-aminoadipate transaminase [Clostridioides difficile]|nr:2-aminoadipate transaminase [Clostridioides difficile]
MGDGGLHIFIKLKNIDTRVLLEKCYEKNVIFMPGDLFFTDNSGFDTLRLGFSRLSFEDIEIGIKIIGETINEMF